jgi:DNA-binding transcriptional ArsR family regulator
MNRGSDHVTADVFSAIADPTRRQLLNLVASGDRPVRILAASFAMSRPAVSKHLRILKEAGLVSEQKIGRERYYRLHPEPLRDVSSWVAHCEQFWREGLDRLGDELEQQP